MRLKCAAGRTQKRYIVVKVFFMLAVWGRGGVIRRAAAVIICLNFFLFERILIIYFTRFVSFICSAHTDDDIKSIIGEKF